MANEFRVRKKLIVNGSGSTILDVQGSQGQLFSVTDSLSGSLFSVKDISGIPVIEAFSDDTVNIGTFNAEAIKVSGSFARITGSLLGTSSWSSNAVTSSYAATASYVSSTSIVGNLTQIATGSVSASVNTDISASFRLTSGSNTLLNVTRDGFVWIGNGSFTNQGYQLDVQGTSRFTGNILFQGEITGPSTTYFNGPTINTGTLNIRYATLSLPATTNAQTLTATTLTVSSNNTVASITGTGVTSFRINNTTLPSTWFFENNRNAVLGSLEISNDLGNPTITLFPSRTIAVGTYTETSSSIFAIASTTKGFLSPRMTSAQKISISNPAQGLQVYDTDTLTEGLWYYSSGSIKGWTRVLNDTGSQSISGSLNVTQAVTASNVLVTNTITAQTLVVQTITSSIEYSSGSNIFGSSLSNTQTLTGSVGITGSLSLIGDSVTVGNQTITGSLNAVTSSNSTAGHRIIGIISASDTFHIEVVQPNLAIDTRGRILYSNFYATTASLPDPSLYHGMFTHVHNQGAGYYSHGSNGWIRIWDQFNYPDLVSSSQVPSLITGKAISPLTVSASSWISASGIYSSGNSTFIGSVITTGSLFITGSTTQVGNNNLLGNTILSGSIIISGALGTNNPTIRIFGDTEHNGYIRFDPVSTNIDNSISASYIYVSGSTNDLYFSQNGSGYSNTTRLRWLEGNLYTGLLEGGRITSQSSTVYQIASGSGIVVNLNASLTNDPYPTITYLQWSNLSASIAPLSASYDQTFVSILSNGTIGTQGVPYVDGDYDTKIPIGVVIHQNHSSINAVQTFPGVAYGWKQRSNSFIQAFGPLKISGYTLAVSGSSTGSLVLSGGTAWVDGRNYLVDPNNPSYINESTGITTSKIYRYRQSGSDWAYDTNNGAGYATIDPTKYSLNGVLTPVASNDWSIQRVYYFPNSATKALYVYYGNATYSNQAAALAAVSTEPFSEAPNTAANAIYVGYMLLRNNADFTVAASYAIYAAGLFRGGGSGGAGGGGGGGSSTLAGLSDVTITSPTDYQPFAYNALTSHWENRSIISASLAGNANTATSSSYAATASILLGSVVSASYAATSSLTVSASYAVTSSYSVTSSYVLSSSFATTASYVTSVNRKVRTTIPIMSAQGQSTLITNIPTAVDEVGTELRVKENLLTATSCSLSARVEQTTAALIGFLKVQYSTDESTWNDLHNNKVDLSVLGTQLTVEEPIPVGAKTSGSFLRLVTVSGDGTSSSNSRFGNVILNIIQDL